MKPKIIWCYHHAHSCGITIHTNNGDEYILGRRVPGHDKRNANPKQCSMYAYEAYPTDTTTIAHVMFNTALRELGGI